MYSQWNIAGVCASVAELMGFLPPEHAEGANRLLVDKAKCAIGEGEHFDRVLLYNPDAIALWLYTQHTDLMSPMAMCTDLQLSLGSVMPSVTPVCFATMYTGVMPKVHGILKYEKPVLKIDTLFDAAIRAGKRCAIVSEIDQSISMIFLEREMDYYLYDTPDQVNQKAKELILEDKYDLVVVYNGNYDTTMHKFGVEAPEALEVLEKNCRDFAALVDACKEGWRGHHAFWGFCPDHGCHEIDGHLGSHGLDMDEDMNVIHAYGWQRKQNM